MSHNCKKGAVMKSFFSSFRILLENPDPNMAKKQDMTFSGKINKWKFTTSRKLTASYICISEEIFN